MNFLTKDINNRLSDILIVKQYKQMANHVNYRQNRDAGYVLINEASYDTKNWLLQRELNGFLP